MPATPDIPGTYEEARLHERTTRVLWVNDTPAPRGGVESYVATTARLLDDRNFESFLLYDPAYPADPTFSRSFRGSFPMVEVAEQVRELDPDVIYVHRCKNDETLKQLVESGRPVLRFFHDHRLFCLREHKYSPILRSTCTRATGLGCYSCPGFLIRGESGRISLRTLGALVESQRANLGLAGWVVASSYMADHIAQHGFDRARIHTIPLYAPVPTAEPSVDTNCTWPDPVRDPDLLLFVGQLIRGKGLDILLKAVARSASSPRLIVAGDGPQEALFRRMARKLHLTERVQFVGRRTTAELGDLYRTCTALVVPSRAPETFGLTGVEAMSHGVPVIAARVGGIGEWLQEGVNGLGFRSGDPADLARAIDTMLVSVERSRAMGEAGLELHRRRFTPPHHLDRLEALIRSVSGSDGQSRGIAA